MSPPRGLRPGSSSRCQGLQAPSETTTPLIFRCRCVTYRWVYCELSNVVQLAGSVLKIHSRCAHRNPTMVAHPKSSTRMVSKALCAMASPGSPAIVKVLVACFFLD
jgi:hypothetical protein